MVLRTILAVYIGLCITAFKDFFEGKIGPVNYLFAAFVIVFCLATLIVTVKPGPEYLNRPNVMRRIGTLYDEVKTQSWD